MGLRSDCLLWTIVGAVCESCSGQLCHAFWPLARSRAVAVPSLRQAPLASGTGRAFGALPRTLVARKLRTSRASHACDCSRLSMAGSVILSQLPCPSPARRQRALLRPPPRTSYRTGPSFAHIPCSTLFRQTGPAPPPPLLAATNLPPVGTPASQSPLSPPEIDRTPAASCHTRETAHAFTLLATVDPLYLPPPPPGHLRVCLQPGPAPPRPFFALFLLHPALPSPSTCTLPPRPKNTPPVTHRRPARAAPDPRTHDHAPRLAPASRSSFTSVWNKAPGPLASCWLRPSPRLRCLGSRVAKSPLVHVFPLISTTIRRKRTHAEGRHSRPLPHPRTPPCRMSAGARGGTRRHLLPDVSECGLYPCSATGLCAQLPPLLYPLTDATLATWSPYSESSYEKAFVRMQIECETLLAPTPARKIAMRTV